MENNIVKRVSIWFGSRKSPSKKSAILFGLYLNVIVIPGAYSQTPGGISSANLRAWYRADMGIGGSPLSVASWSSIVAGTGVPISTTSKVGTGTITQNILPNSFNYNYSLFIPGSPVTSLRNPPSSTTESDLFGNPHTGSYFAVGIASDMPFSFYMESGSPFGHLYNTGPRWSGATFNSYNLAYSTVPFSNSANIYGQVLNYLGPYRLALCNGYSNASISYTPQMFSISYRFEIGGFPGYSYGSSLSEIVIYNVALSTIEYQKVDSYLGIKYGINLFHDYLSTSGTTIYSTAGSYTNHIIGIGRDDATSLLQKQSHSRDDSVRVYLGTLTGTNAANVSTINNDLSFVVTGSNNGNLCSAASTSLEIPSGCGINSRLEREWKVTKTNLTQVFNMDVKLNACAVTNSVNVSHLRLLVDDDGNFFNGGTNCFYNGDASGLVISYASPVITLSNLSNTHFPNNTTKYFTLASTNYVTPLPVQLMFFNGVSIDKNTNRLFWSTASELNNDYFEIEKSTDAINFEALGRVKGGGTSNQIRKYEFFDYNAQPGYNYYRLKQVDFDGKVHISDIVTFESNPSGNYRIYPNPFVNNGTGSSLIIENVSTQITVEIFNPIGMLVYRRVVPYTGNKVYITDLEIPNGVYTLICKSNQNNQISKFVVE